MEFYRSLDTVSSLLTVPSIANLIKLLLLGWPMQTALRQSALILGLLGAAIGVSPSRGSFCVGLDQQD